MLMLVFVALAAAGLEVEISLGRAGLLEVNDILVY